MVRMTSIARHQFGVSVNFEQGAIRAQFSRSGENGQFYLMSMWGPWTQVNNHGEPDNPAVWTIEIDEAHEALRNEAAGETITLLDSINFGIPAWNYVKCPLILSVDEGRAQILFDFSKGFPEIVNTMPLAGASGEDYSEKLAAAAERIKADLSSGTGLGRLDLSVN